MTNDNAIVVNLIYTQIVVVVVVVRLSMFVCVVQFLVLWMSFPPLYSCVTPSLSPGAIPRVPQQFEDQSVTLSPPSCVMRPHGCVPSHRVGWSFITVPCHVIRGNKMNVTRKLPSFSELLFNMARIIRLG